MLRDRALEAVLFELTTKKYPIFKEYDFYTSEEEVVKKIERIDPYSFYINGYSIFHLKIMNLVKQEASSNDFFDQIHNFVPRKSIHNDGNFYCTTAEICNIANDILRKPSTESFLLQIFMRTRALSIIGEWDDTVDCDSLFYNQECSKSFLDKCKSYFLHNSKYLRYTRLLLAALENGEYFEHLIPVSTTLSEYKQLLHNPFIFVILKPFDFLQKLKDENSKRKEYDFDFLDELLDNYVLTE